MVKIQSGFGRFFDANRADLHYEITFYGVTNYIPV